MTPRRTTRVSEVIRKEVSTLMARCRDFEGQIVTISEVKTTPDLKQAFIFFSVLDPKADHEAISAVLEENRLEWQRLVGKKLKTKFTPQLKFQFDGSIERGDRVMEIMREIEEENAARNKQNGDA